MVALSSVVLLSVMAVVYNNVVNLWKPFHSWAYVPINVTFAGVLTVIAAQALDLSGGKLGFRADPAALVVPVVIIAAAAVVMLAIAYSRQGHRIADARVEGMRGGRLAFYTLVRIPLGTAVTEEVIFRAALFAAWLEAGLSDLAAGVASSAAFGLWHVSPTIIGVRMNDPDASAERVRAAVVGAVVITTIVGLGFAWLRMWTVGLAGPIVLHAGVNSVSALAAVRAGRKPTHPR